MHSVTEPRRFSPRHDYSLVVRNGLHLRTSVIPSGRLRVKALLHVSSEKVRTMDEAADACQPHSSQNYGYNELSLPYGYPSVQCEREQWRIRGLVIR